MLPPEKKAGTELSNRVMELCGFFGLEQVAYAELS